MTGIPTSAAAIAFNASPSLKRNPRREVVAGSESCPVHIASHLSVHSFVDHQRLSLSPPGASGSLALAAGRPGTGLRWATSQATTSEISADARGRPER